MFPLLLMLLPDPSASPDTVPPPAPAVRYRLLDGPPGSRCGETGFVRIERPAAQPDLLQNDLTFRRDGEVRRYLLLDRSVAGCPAPISFALPGSPDSVNREPGRPQPMTSAPGRVQPPRSSE
jgi:hypothetical protein